MVVPSLLGANLLATLRALRERQTLDAMLTGAPPPGSASSRMPRDGPGAMAPSAGTCGLPCSGVGVAYRKEAARAQAHHGEPLESWA